MLGRTVTPREIRARGELTCVPCPNLARDFHIPAVQQHDALNDGQSQPSSSRCLGARCIHSEKAVEHLSARLRRNAVPGIRNFDAESPRRSTDAPSTTDLPGGVCASAFETKISYSPLQKSAVQLCNHGSVGHSCGKRDTPVGRRSFVVFANAREAVRRR